MAKLTVEFPWEIGQKIWSISGDFEDCDDSYIEPVVVEGYEIESGTSWKSCTVTIRYVDGRREFPEISEGENLIDEKRIRDQFLFTHRTDAKKFMKEWRDR